VGANPAPGQDPRFHEPGIPSRFSPGSQYDAALRAYEEGYTHYRWGRFTQAETKLKEALSREPNLIKAHYWLGKVYREMGKLKEAIFHAEQVLHLTRLINERRQALSLENNEYPALSQIQLMKDREKNAEDAYERGRHFLETGHWDAAVAEFKAAATYYPGNSIYLLQVARILWDRHDSQGSSKYYATFLDLLPTDHREILEAIDRMIAAGNIRQAAIFLRREQGRFPKETAFQTRLDQLGPGDADVPAGIGKVIQRASGQVILDLGLEHGLKLADEYNLGFRTFRPGDPVRSADAKRTIGRFPDEVSGHLLLTKVFARSCWALVQEEFGKGIKVGDLVEIKSRPR
jgi:tetratricopeptide (TPR) repeat protein